jgi:Ca2+-binding EF-hand superfamily protein
MYEQMFSHYDKDKSGSIDTNELKALLAELGRQVRYTTMKGTGLFSCIL